MIVIVDCSIVLMIFGRTRARTHCNLWMRRNKYTLSSEQRWQQIIFRLLFLFRTFSRRYNLLLPALLIIVHCSYSFLWCIWLTVFVVVVNKKKSVSKWDVSYEWFGWESIRLKTNDKTKESQWISKLKWKSTWMRSIWLVRSIWFSFGSAVSGEYWQFELGWWLWTECPKWKWPLRVQEQIHGAGVEMWKTEPFRRRINKRQQNVVKHCVLSGFLDKHLTFIFQIGLRTWAYFAATYTHY